MDIPPRLSDEEFCSIYQQAFTLWTRLHLRIVKEPELPRDALFPTISQDHPTLSSTLDLDHDGEGLFATGFSTWTSARAGCFTDLPPFEQSLRIMVSVKQPVILTISNNDEHSEACARLTGSDNCYLPILILAWSYILSARWAEVLSEPCTLAYTRVKSAEVIDTPRDNVNGDTTEVFLGDAKDEEARWWASVLAPGQGWEAQTQSQGTKNLSPWSIDLQWDQEFILRRTSGNSLSFASPPKFREARNYLEKFCIRRNIADQSQAALSAVLLIPARSSSRKLSLPFPHIDESGWFRSSEVPCSRDFSDMECKWTRDDCQMDKLLTLSCNVRGIRPMLLSTFYEPSIECNAVTPWLQGTITAIERLGGSNPYWISRMCMERAPTIGFLWLGVCVLGLHQCFLQDLRFGQIPIDLHSAAWSRSIQSFIQDRSSVPLSKNGYVSRADECKLLYLSQSNTHARLPLCQWKPFGATAIEHTDFEVRNHLSCNYHQLRYEGFSWKCQGGTYEFQSSAQSHDSFKITNDRHDRESCDSTNSISICFQGMNREREALSENATRNILRWLRPDGYAPGEAELWKHEWFEPSESDDDEVDSGDNTPSEGPNSLTQVLPWLSHVTSNRKIFGNDESYQS